VANDSDQVGRNLMRHAIELQFLRGSRTREGEHRKQISLSDFYLPGDRSEGRKLGTVQSLGALPSGADVLGRMPPLMRAFARPFVSTIWQHHIRPINVLAAIMEDLPHADNRVTPGTPFTNGARQRLRMQVPVERPGPRSRGHFSIASSRERWRRCVPVQSRWRKRNAAVAHACGTCRFGTDPALSVLDANNRAHGLDNLYVVDASFFPSSSGTNPSLTIACKRLARGGTSARPDLVTSYRQSGFAVNRVNDAHRLRAVSGGRDDRAVVVDRRHERAQLVFERRRSGGEPLMRAIALETQASSDETGAARRD